MYVYIYKTLKKFPKTIFILTKYVECKKIQLEMSGIFQRDEKKYIRTTDSILFGEIFLIT